MKRDEMVDDPLSALNADTGENICGTVMMLKKVFSVSNYIFCQKVIKSNTIQLIIESSH